MNWILFHVKAFILVIIIVLRSSALAQDKEKRIGEIEFFGSAGIIDLNKVRAALPFHEGDEFRIETEGEKVRHSIEEAVKQVTGHRPTDIAPTCCDNQGNWIIYIGVSRKAIVYNPQPKGATRLPKTTLELYERFMSALSEAVQKGAAAEDRSRGYALSEYPPLRSIQLEMRSYAIAHEALLRRVLATSADNQQRIVAAELLGYARQSRSQLAALVHASRDSDDSVRNNATRALLVLVESKPNLARDVPAEGFIELLLSGTWTDLNKAGFLLSSITRDRNPKLLARLRTVAVQERLIEMARWRTGHAEAARYLLGRMAGVDEKRLQQLVTSGKVEEILTRLQAK
ncbi:MAG TPA: hypothetical protein VGV87_23645 [Blastocatellia bacterium]|nr:hypothetical protein [Blastocatellia bacterium]